MRPLRLGVGLSALLVLASVAPVIAAVHRSTPNRAAAHPVVLTLWENYGTEDEATATYALAKAFHQSHPGIEVKVVSQPASNYFALLQAAAISRSGPDLAVMWTGLFTLKYDSFLLNLNHYMSVSSLNRLSGINWSANNFNVHDGTYVVPLENQFYIGFYNKALFNKAGLSGPPRDWTELVRDAKLLKAHHITPMLYGSGSQNLGSEFYPFYDLSYLMAGVFSPSQWKGLYDGKIAWTSPTVVRQVSRWVALYKDGFTNRNVLTTINSLGLFEKGDAAMLIKGNWDLAPLQAALGSKLGTFVPPYSQQPMHGVIEFPGDGISATTYSQHIPQAIQFLKFLMSPQAQRIEVKAGLIPDLKGFSTPNPISNAMLDFAAKDHFTEYPMLDNVVQPNVVTAAAKELDAAFAGEITVRAALENMQRTLKALPPDQRSTSYR